LKFDDSYIPSFVFTGSGDGKPHGIRTLIFSYLRVFVQIGSEGVSIRILPGDRLDMTHDPTRPKSCPADVRSLLMLLSTAGGKLPAAKASQAGLGCFASGAARQWKCRICGLWACEWRQRHC
jgi:hypothetical protein